MGPRLIREVCEAVCGSCEVILGIPAGPIPYWPSLSLWRSVNTSMKIISKILTVFATSTFIVMCSVVFLEVIFRHFLLKPLVWSEELARIMLIWTVFSGAAALLIRGEHIALEFLLEKATGKVGTCLRIFNSLIVAIFLACMVIGSYRMIHITWVVRAESVPIIRMAYQYTVVFVGAVVMFLFTLGSLYRILKDLSKRWVS